MTIYPAVLFVNSGFVSFKGHHVDLLAITAESAKKKKKKFPELAFSFANLHVCLTFLSQTLNWAAG